MKGMFHEHTLRIASGGTSSVECSLYGRQNTWRSLFASSAQLFDDGASRDLATFTEEALGHERFTKIHCVANEGLDVYGEFHSDQWGDFPFSSSVI